MREKLLGDFEAFVEGFKWSLSILSEQEQYDALYSLMNALLSKVYTLSTKRHEYLLVSFIACDSFQTNGSFLLPSNIGQSISKLVFFAKAIISNSYLAIESDENSILSLRRLLDVGCNTEIGNLKSVKQLAGAYADEDGPPVNLKMARILPLCLPTIAQHPLPI